MGYMVVDPFTPAAVDTPAMGLWRLPDSGQVRVALEPDGRFAAKLDSESGAEEGKWCADARELLRRLAADGVPYEIVFERRLPEIPVVALETADELLDGEEEDTRAAMLAQKARRQRT